MADDSPDWKQQPRIVGLLIFFWPPLGFYLLWKHPTWQKPTKWIVTGCYAALVIVACAFSEKDKPNRSVEYAAPLPRSAAAPSPPPEPKPARGEAFDKKYEALVYRIQPGMTQQHVEDCLGPADETKHTDIGRINPQKTGQTLTMLTWRDGERFITLGFMNGVLTSGGTPGYDIEKGFHSK